jgi:two-component system NarL family sensor kinase
MSRTRRLAVILAAWAIPIAWVTGALLAGPADGTLVSPPTAMLAADRWGDAATVVRAYGDTPLQEGDTILSIDGRPVGEWLSSPAPRRTVGDAVAYEVLRARSSGALDLTLELDVTLTRYPFLDALSRNLTSVTLTVLLLAAGSFAFWHRPRHPAARAFLSAGALLPCVLTSYPFGLGAIDLAGARGVWPHLVGEVGGALGLGALLGTALTLVGTPGWLRRHPWAYAAPYAAPFAGYAVWLLVVAAREESQAARLQSTITVWGPAAVATAAALLAALVLGYLWHPDRDDRLALRLVLLVTAGAVGVRLLLGDLPERLAGRAVLPWNVQALLLAPAVLGCLVVAILRYRLDEVEATVRRALVRALVAALVGTAFLATVGAVNLASDTSVGAMVAGGAVALLLLPVAVGLNRVLRRVVYGDREFPHRVVSELRRLDPLTEPAEALQEMLALLARRLRLSYAGIEVFGTTPSDRIDTSVGEPHGRATTVDLAVGDASLGRLRLEVSPSRDPFGPGDRRLLEDVGAQVGALVQAVRVNRELQRSRQRLITAREEERRRLRRDLHDGLGPSLATLAMHLEAARDLIGEDPHRAADLVGELAEQTRGDIGEVRRLVDGLRPPALDQLGLVSALQQRADQHNLAAREQRGEPRMTWSVQAADDLEPLPAAVEVAAYRIVVEAVTNALRHSSAETCAVTLDRDERALHIRIRDTGNGVSPTPRPGVGLSSMRERAAELGGTCTLTSSPGVGTVIEARLPITATPTDESRRW